MKLNRIITLVTYISKRYFSSTQGILYKCPPTKQGPETSSFSFRETLYRPPLKRGVTREYHRRRSWCVNDHRWMGRIKISAQSVTDSALPLSPIVVPQNCTDPTRRTRCPTLTPTPLNPEPIQTQEIECTRRKKRRVSVKMSMVPITTFHRVTVRNSSSESGTLPPTSGRVSVTNPEGSVLVVYLTRVSSTRRGPEGGFDLCPTDGVLVRNLTFRQTSRVLRGRGQRRVQFDNRSRDHCSGRKCHRSPPRKVYGFPTLVSEK